MFDRRTFFTALGSGVAATALVAVAGSAQAAPIDTLIGQIAPEAPAPADASEALEMRGRRHRHRHHRRHRRIVRRHRRAVRRARRAN